MILAILLIESVVVKKTNEALIPIGFVAQRFEMQSAPN